MVNDIKTVFDYVIFGSKILETVNTNFVISRFPSETAQSLYKRISSHSENESCHTQNTNMITESSFDESSHYFFMSDHGYHSTNL